MGLFPWKFESSPGHQLAFQNELVFWILLVLSNISIRKKETNMVNHLHRDDLPGNVDLGPVVAVDSETMGLDVGRDRLCLIQLSSGDGDAHLVQFYPGSKNAPHLISILSDPKVLKLFHFARFDVAVIRQHLNVVCKPLYCTKIASKLVRTYTDRHGLKDLCRDLLDIDLSKEQQSSDWGREDLTEHQINYAANDVLYLHRLRECLDTMLSRERRTDLADACFDFLPIRAELDVSGWGDQDIFSH